MNRYPKVPDKYFPPRDTPAAPTMSFYDPGYFDATAYNAGFEDGKMQAEAEARSTPAEAHDPVYLHWSEYDDSATVKGWGGDDIYKCRECPEWQGDSESAPRHSALHAARSTPAEALDVDEYFLSRLKTMASFGYQPMYNGRPSCPFCAHFTDDEDTHADSCDLMAFLRLRSPESD
jgi:hypothetical protein